MRARRHSLGGLGGGKAGTNRKAAAQSLGQRHNVRRYPGALIGKKLARAPHAALNLVEDEEQAALVTESPQRLEELRWSHSHAALALNGLDQDGGGRFAHRGLGRGKIAEWDLIEALDCRAEALEIFFLPAGGQGRESSAVEGALEGNDAELFRLAAGGMVFAGDLDRAFDGFGSGIVEKHEIREACRAKPLGQPLAFRNAIEIGDVPDLFRLLGQRLDQPRMRVAERVDADAGGKIEIALAAGRGQPGTLAPLESKVDARISRQ